MKFDAVEFLEGLFDPDPPPRRAWPDSPAELPADWYVEWDERAAIMEYDGGLTREHAEAEAFKLILDEIRRAGVI